MAAERIDFTLTAKDQVTPKLKVVRGELDKVEKSAQNAFGKPTTSGGLPTLAGAVRGGGLAGMLGNAGVVAGLTAGAIVGVGAAIWNLAAPTRQFERGMSRVRAVMRPTNDEFGKMEALAKRMGASTAFTATQASDGLLNLGKAGLSASESMEALAPTLYAAAAGELALGEAADIVTNIMGGMGLAVSD